MKNRKKFILIFSLFWALGLLGGYYLGVGSAILPTESVEYNYYFSKNNANPHVETVPENFVKEAKEDVKPSECKSKKRNVNSFIQMRSFNFNGLSEKLLQHLLSPSACNNKPVETTSSTCKDSKKA